MANLFQLWVDGSMSILIVSCGGLGPRLSGGVRIEFI